MGDVQNEDEHLAKVLAEGQEALLQALEEAGALWSAEEVARQFGATPAAVLEWLREERFLAVRRADGSLAFPAAQFEAQWTEGLAAPRSFACIESIIRAARDMNHGELAGLLVTPQEVLATGEGATSRPARTGFEAIADGDCSRVVELVRELAIPADEGAPPMPENWPS